MLCLAGARPIAEPDTWPLQDLDQVGIVSPTTNWARSCVSASRIGEYTTLALAQARSGRPGPVYLDVPVDVLDEELPDATPITRYTPPAPPAPEPRALEQASRLLQRAERPIVLAGSGAHWSRAGEALAQLSETAGLPILTFNQGRGVLPDPKAGAITVEHDEFTGETTVTLQHVILDDDLQRIAPEPREQPACDGRARLGGALQADHRTHGLGVPGKRHH